MPDKPLVSVLMTVYNREKYIKQAIESVTASTYQNWELIIVDDFSKDSSVAIANTYAQQDDRIKVYVNEKNLGDYPNRNQAASYAKGKYLKYVDADDAIYPHGLEVMVKYMEAFPEAALGICRPDEDEKIFPYIMLPKETYNKHFGEGLLLNAPTSTIIRKKEFDELGGFSGTQFIGDTELWLKLSAKFAVVIMMKGLTWWRGHEDQQKKLEEKSTEPIINRFLLDIKSVQSFSEFSQNEKEYFTEKIKVNAARRMLSSLAKGREFRKFYVLQKECDISPYIFLKAFQGYK